MSELQLSVCSVDLLSSKMGQNRKEHHTDLFHGDEMIIRRGQPFQMEVEFNKAFNADTDKLHLELKTGMEHVHKSHLCVSSHFSDKSRMYLGQKCQQFEQELQQKGKCDIDGSGAGY